jgi:ethanolamine transporter EutH
MSRLVTLLGRIGTVLVSIGLAAAIVYELPLLVTAEESKARLLAAIEITIPVGLLLAVVWFMVYIKKKPKPATV